MNYLVGENVYAYNSGTEFSQFERLMAFNNNGIKTILLTRNYSRFLARDIKMHGLNAAQICNMYDYFQGVQNLENKDQNLRYLKTVPLDYYHVVGVDNNHSNIDLNGKTVGTINVMPSTVGLVGDIIYNDSLGQKAVREYWDWRGFKSMVETYHPTGDVANQRYLDINGNPVIEVVYMYINKTIKPTMWKLLNYRGKDYQFDNENQLFLFFLNEVNQIEKGIFISDRRTLDDVVLNVSNAQKKYVYIHSVPYSNYKNPNNSELDPMYNVAFGLSKQTSNKFDAIIFPTEDEANDIGIRLNANTSCINLPDSYVNSDNESRTLNAKKHLVYVGRLAEEKNIIDLIQVFKAVREKRSDIQLDLQGYFSSEDYKNKVKDMVRKLELNNLVNFIPYSPDISKIYENATLFINTSYTEGFGMNMLESMAKGVPVVSYANLYSRINLIKNNFNGFTIKNKSYMVLANHINSLLNSEKDYAALSSGALATAKEYSERRFVQKWKALLTIH